MTRRLLRYLLSESPRLLLLGTATAIAQSVLLIPIALLVRRVFDLQIPRHQTGAIVRTGVLVVALYGASACFGYISRAAALRTTAGVATRLRVGLLTKLYTLPQQWRDRQRAGALHSLSVQDTDRVELMLVDVASAVIPALLTGFALVLVALVVNPLLFLALLAVVVPLMVVTRLLTRRTRAQAQQWARSSSHFSSETQLLLRMIGLTTVVGGQAWELERAQQRARDLAESYRAFGVGRAAVIGVQNALGAASGSVVLIVGGIAVARHTLSLGNLLSFYAILALLLRQLHTLGWQSNSILVGLQSLVRIEALLELEQREPYVNGRRELRFRGEISLEQVSFAYDEVPVLRDIELSIAAGERVALIGPNGAGKSTLVSLLLGLYQPTGGQLRADGVPYAELDMGSLRHQIGVVLQDPVLLPGTVRENIAYGRSDASDARVAEAAQAATAARFIEALPASYATIVGDEGAGLSGGQRQRIAIARALLGRPALLVLDEPTTYLDEAAVSELMAQLSVLPQAPSVLLVTHDPQVAVHAERVIELRDGRLVGESRLVARAAGVH